MRPMVAVERIYLTLLFLCLSLTGYSQIQTGQPADAATATPIPGSGHDYLHLLSETVDPLSGSVDIQINFGAPKGRGITIPAVYHYNTGSVFVITQDSITQQVEFEMPYNIGTNTFSAGGLFPVATWAESSVQAPPTIEGTGGTTIYQPVCNYATSFTFRDMAGVNHNLSLTVVGYANNAPQQGNGTCPTQAGGSGTDGQVTAAFPTPSTNETDVSDWPYNSQGDPQVTGVVGPFTVSDAAGNTYFFGGGGSYVPSTHVWQAYASEIEDRNGNEITTTGCGTPTTVVYCDTLLHPVISSTDNSITVGGVAYTLSNGTVGESNETVGEANINYTVPEYPYTFYNNALELSCPSTNWNVSASGTNSVAREQIIGLPNGTNYTLYFGDYNPTDSSVENPYGLINEIIYPDKGWVKYTWQMSPQYEQSGAFAGKYLPGTANAGQVVSNGCIYEYSTPVLETRKVSFDGTTIAQSQSFSLTSQWSEGEWTAKTTQVTTTDETTNKSALTVYSTFPGGGAGAPNTTSSWASGIPLERTITRYDWNNVSTPLDTETEGWYTGSIQPELACDFHTGYDGKSTGHFYQYAYGQISDDKQYDYGQIANPAAACTGSNPTAPSGVTPTRETVTQFQQFTNPIGTVFGKPHIITVYNQGVQQTQTTIAYDQGTIYPATATNHDNSAFGTTTVTGRGNPTTVASGSSTTSYTYDETGQVLSMTSPCGNATCSDVSGTNHTTTYSYADSPNGGNSAGQSNAYLTQVTDPLGHTTKYSYNYSTGGLASSTDENNQTTNYTYSDPLNRLTEVQEPVDPNNSNQRPTINYCYSDVPSSPCPYSTPLIQTSQLLNTSGTFKISQSIMDGMGHVTRATEVSDPSGTDYVDTTYDGEGNVVSVTNPYRTTSDPTYGVTKYTYDALNRKITQAQPDGAALTWCYEGFSSGQGHCFQNLSGGRSSDAWVDYTDETGRHWQHVSDAFGNLQAVMEPDASGNDTIETDYQYDALNNLIHADQWGGAHGSGGVRTRVFSYDSLSRLISSLNPEVGTTTYSYDANGNLMSKISPAPNSTSGTITTSYTYDALNRLLSKISNDVATTPASCYQYDGSQQNNMVGRLVNEWTQSVSANGGSCAPTMPASGANLLTSKSFLKYDPMGRPLNIQTCVYPTCTTNLPEYPLQYTYDLAGDITSYTNGNNSIVFTKAYDGAARLSSITSSWPTGPACLFAAQTTVNSSTPACSLTQTTPYAAFGGLSNAVYGNSLTLQRSYDNRLRITGETDTNGASSGGQSQ